MDTSVRAIMSPRRRHQCHDARAASFTTTEVQSLSVSFAAALEAVADANTRFLAGGTGVQTRSAWVNWATRAQGPTDQIQAISGALGKCP